MILSRALSILLLATVTSLAAAGAGCKKKEQAASGTPAPSGETKPAEAKPAEARPAEAKPAEAKLAAPPQAAAAGTPAAAAPAAAAGTGDVASDDDYISKASAFMDKMTEIFKAGGTSCDKIADDLTRFATDNNATIDALRAYEKAHPEVRKKTDAVTKDKNTAFEAAAGPAIGACQNNQKLADALNKIAPG